MRSEEQLVDEGNQPAVIKSTSVSYCKLWSADVTDRVWIQQDTGKPR